MKYLIENYKGNNYLIFPDLIKMGLYHCFTTTDMDMGLKTNGSVENIKENFEEIYDFMGKRPIELYSGFQTHTNNVVNVTSIEDGAYYGVGKYFQETDGLVTKIPGIGLVTRFADCTPILLFDPVKKVQGNIHSGWKGTLKEIGGEAVDKMVKEHGSNPQDIIVILGPAIGRDDFEVDIDVMELFRDKFPYHNDFISRKNDMKYLIDLREIIIRTLENKGIAKENIHPVDISTFSDKRFHSFRRDKEAFGQMACITMISK